MESGCKEERCRCRTLRQPRWLERKSSAKNVRLYISRSSVITKIEWPAELMNTYKAQRRKGEFAFGDTHGDGVVGLAETALKEHESNSAPAGWSVAVPAAKSASRGQSRRVGPETFKETFERAKSAKAERMYTSRTSQEGTTKE